ncbi:MAG: T9SS type A sorting domain-containing protein [bacterium]
MLRPLPPARCWLLVLLAFMALVPRGAEARPDARGTQKRLYLANDDHTDYLWTGGVTAYRQAFQDMIDYYLDQADATAGQPEDFRGKFNLDGTLWLWEYERARSAADFDRLLDHVRDGSITVPVNPLVQLYGAMSPEQIIRGGYYAGRLERQEGLSFPLVVPMENQTIPGGVASLWAGCGVKYSWKGICNCVTQIDAADRPREVYRFAGPDGRSILMKWNSLLYDEKDIGGYAEARDPAVAVDRLDADPAFLSRWPFDVAGAFGHGWDDLQTTTDAFLNVAQSRSNASRRVIVSNEIDFFEDFEATHGNDIDTFGGAFGNEWDLYVASLAEPTAELRRATERLRGVEALSTLALLADSSFWSTFAAGRDSAMLACGLYAEHSFSPGPGVSEQERADWQRSIQETLTSYVNDLDVATRARLGELVDNPNGAERHAVFNPLSWSRTDVARITVSTPFPFHVIDVVTNKPVPFQLVSGRDFAILAEDVPAVGYRVYEVRGGAGPTFPPVATFAGATLDNGAIAVTMGPRGQLTSVIDHTRGDLQLVANGGAWGDFENGTSPAVIGEVGPVFATVRALSGGSPAHETRVRLYGGSSPRIDLEATVTENFGGFVDTAWDVAVPGGTWRHEEVGMIATARTQANGGDYANANARTDWLTLNHFLDRSNASFGVTLSSADSPFFRLGGSTPTFLDENSPRATLTVGMQVDGSVGGIANQGGDSFFLHRVAARPHDAWTATEAMRFALEHQNPLLTFRVTGAGPYPAASYSLLGADTSAILWALKPHEDGRGAGVVTRWWNLEDTSPTLTMTWPNDTVVAAWETSHLETDLQPLATGTRTVSLPLLPHGLSTARVALAATTTTVTSPSGPRIDLSIAPNPARTGIDRAIRFVLPADGPVKITAYDLHGRRVERVAQGRWPAGPHTVHWAADVAAGVYFLRLETDSGETAKRVVVLGH